MNFIKTLEGLKSNGGSIEVTLVYKKDVGFVKVRVYDILEEPVALMTDDITTLIKEGQIDKVYNTLKLLFLQSRYFPSIPLIKDEDLSAIYYYINNNVIPNILSFSPLDYENEVSFIAYILNENSEASFVDFKPLERREFDKEYIHRLNIDLEGVLGIKKPEIRDPLFEMKELEITVFSNELAFNRLKLAFNFLSKIALELSYHNKTYEATILYEMLSNISFDLLRTINFIMDDEIGVEGKTGFKEYLQKMKKIFAQIYMNIASNFSQEMMMKSDSSDFVEIGKQKRNAVEAKRYIDLSHRLRCNIPSELYIGAIDVFESYIEYYGNLFSIEDSVLKMEGKKVDMSRYINLFEYIVGQIEDLKGEEDVKYDLPSIDFISTIGSYDDISSMVQKIEEIYKRVEKLSSSHNRYKGSIQSYIVELLMKIVFYKKDIIVDADKGLILDFICYLESNKNYNPIIKGHIENIKSLIEN